MDWLDQKLGGRAVALATYLAIALALGTLLRAARRGREIGDLWGGSLLSRHHALFRGLGHLMGFVAPVAVPILWVVMPRKEGDEVWALVVRVMFLALGLPLWWEGTRFALLASPRGLECRSPWRAEPFFAWDEVERVTYSPQYMRPGMIWSGAPSNRGAADPTMICGRRQGGPDRWAATDPWARSIAENPEAGR